MASDLSDPSERERLRRGHNRVVGSDEFTNAEEFCASCLEPWPCVAISALDLIENLIAERDEVRLAHEALRRRGLPVTLDENGDRIALSSPEHEVPQ
jgi:hypothetical protein